MNFNIPKQASAPSVEQVPKKTYKQTGQQGDIDTFLRQNGSTLGMCFNLMLSQYHAEGKTSECFDQDYFADVIALFEKVQITQKEAFERSRK